AALEQEGVPRGDRQGSHLWQAVGTGLEYHQQCADGHCSLLQEQVVGDLGPAQHPPDECLRVVGDHVKAGVEVDQLCLGQLEAAEEGGLCSFELFKNALFKIS